MRFLALLLLFALVLSVDSFACGCKKKHKARVQENEFANELD